MKRTQPAKALRAAIIAVTMAAAIAVPMAHADQPVITPLPSSDFVDAATCGFAVSVHYTQNGETLKAFSSGKVLITGPLAAQFSANGKSVSVNISGPVQIEPTNASVTIVGRGVGAGPILTPNGVTLGYAAGAVWLDPTGGPAVLIHGRLLLDICAALRP